MDTRQVRMARNEALFREVNERIEDIQRPLASGDRIDFLCECGNDDCTQPITLTMAEYEQVRASPKQFAVAPGHEVIDVERVVFRTERYEIVEKFRGAPAKVALERDPRT